MGDAWGQTALADVDRDGDLDFITGRRGGDVVWHEYHSATRWTRHLLSQNSPSAGSGARRVKLSKDTKRLAMEKVCAEPVLAAEK